MGPWFKSMRGYQTDDHGPEPQGSGPFRFRSRLSRRRLTPGIDASLGAAPLRSFLTRAAIDRTRPAHVTSTAPHPCPPRRGPSTALVLAIATVAVSTAAPLIRLSEMPALAHAAWRTLLCGLVYAAWRPTQLRALASLDQRGRLALVSGSTLLAVHFALWISAFEHTSYASAVLLLVMQPVFGALLGMLVLGERHGRGTWMAVAGSAAGLALLVHDDLGHSGGLFGDALAVGGSLAIALFYLAVRPLRTGFPFAPFMAACYGLAGIQLAALSLAIGSPLTGFPQRGWLSLAGLVLVPTVVGHACFNWCVPRVRFFTLNLLIVLEPALAILMGVVLLDESATQLQIVGGVVLGAAVLVGLRPSAGRRRDRPPAETP